MRRHLVILLVLLGAGLEAQQLIFYDGMSSFPSGWRLDTVNGYWARSNRRYWSPGYSAHCVNAAQYNNNQNNSMRRAIDVSAYRVGLLTFWYWGYISNNTPPPPHTPDRVFLECFRGSIQAWDTIWERAGNSAAWESLGFLIPADAESLCFLFHSDYDVVDSGAYIDDIYLRGYNPDVRTAAIVTPRGTIDSGATIIPHCRVYNDSALGVSYYAKCFIEPDYEDSMLVFSHAPRCTQDVYFRAWTPRARGKWAIRCSTAYHLDAVPGNNCLVESIKVGVHDMGCAGIVQPGSVIDSGFPVTPQAYLRNYGTYGESLSAVMKLGNFYTEWVNDLFVLPGESLLVQFRTRLANGSRGLHAVTCSAAITRNPDQNPVNNALVGGVLVEVHDVAALEVTSPPTVVDSGVVVIPSALVHNPGTAREDFLSRFRIGSSYADSQLVLNLAPGDTRTVTFRAWIAQPGTYTASCSTELGMDLSRSNNCARRQFSVRYADVAVTRILKPNSQIMPGVQTPKIELLNCGTVAMSNVLCSLAIGPSYSQALTRPSLGPGVCCTLSYPTWNAGAGVWTARARVLVGGDMYPNNDTLSKTIDVSATPHHDLAVTGFRYPGRQVDPGDVVPVISVANLGNSVETNVPLRLVIDSTGGQVRVDSQVLASLAPGDEAEVAFRTWWAFSGNYRLTAFSRLTGDEARSNDTARLDVLVAAHDIATLEVLAPSGEIGIGHTIYPRIRLTNKGSVTDSFAVIAEIRRGTSLLYRDSGHVRIRRYETLNAVLPGWVPLDTGNHQIKAWANIMGDRNPDNDTIEDVFLVAEASVDAAARQIISPEDTIGTGLVWPRIRVANTGNVMISFWAAMTIRREELITYQDSSWVNALVPGEERTVGLPLWNPEVGSWLVEGRVRCAGDPNKSNDEVS
ncbi:MAG: hypothetical protein ABIK62_01940, partial [candidate division WOR-3 bacterium]